MPIAHDETAICDRLNELADALRTRDIEGLMAHYAPDTVVFDLRPPHRIASAAAYRRNFEAWFASVDGPIGYEIHDLAVTARDDWALCHSLNHVQFKRTNGEDADYWVRVTSGLRRIGGRWMIVHEHVSMPIDLPTMQPRLAMSE